MIAYATFSTFDALILDCTYSMRNLWWIKNLYTCKARVVFVGDQRFVTQVSQNHLSGRGNSQVQGLLIENQPMTYVPGNIHYFFMNLEALNIYNCGVNYLRREDINNLPRLRQLYLYYNNIHELGNNLFEGNPSMKHMSFTSNPIKHIAHNVFDYLYSLETLDMASATCISVNNGNRNAVKAVLFRFAVSCPPTFEMIFERMEKRLLQGAELKRQVDEQVSERINPLTWSLNQTQEQLELVDKRVTELENKCENLNTFGHFLGIEKPKAFY